MAAEQNPGSGRCNSTGGGMASRGPQEPQLEQGFEAQKCVMAATSWPVKTVQNHSKGVGISRSWLVLLAHGFEVALLHQAGCIFEGHNDLQCIHAGQPSGQRQFWDWSKPSNKLQIQLQEQQDTLTNLPGRQVPGSSIVRSGYEDDCGLAYRLLEHEDTSFMYLLVPHCEGPRFARTAATGQVSRR
ncbi:hypothetical protein ABBQ38_004502 [Trebouxia sp. C0009 RCD-2024]